jgi:nucleoside-diphosphate-sugar epimerase
VAVTGASGFIGTHLLAQLCASGHTVRALTRAQRPPATRPDRRVTWITGALADGQGLDQLLAGADVVMHCAGAVRGACAADFDAINVDGTRHLVEAAAKANVERLLMLSSLAAREPGLSMYSNSKRRGEETLARADLCWTVFRPPAVYGPGDKELTPLFALMRRGLAVTPGHTGRFSLLYVADLVRAMIAWLDASEVCGRCFEIDDGTAGGYDWAALIAAAEAQRGGHVWHWAVPRGLLEGLAAMNQWRARALHQLPMLTPGKVRELFHHDWVCHTGDAPRSLNWRPEIRFGDGLRLTFAT